MPAAAHSSAVTRVHAQRLEHRQKAEGRDDQEAEAVSQCNVEDDDADDDERTAEVFGAWRRGGFLIGVGSRTKAAQHERHAAQQQTGADQHRQEAGTDFLPRHVRERARRPQHRSSQQGQREAQPTVGALHGAAYLAMPTAVITAFMSASPLAMNDANSPELPHNMPKPRWAMKSLYSLLS